MAMVPANTRVLELGCASGYLSGYLTGQKNCTVTGLEIDPLAADLADRRGVQVIQGDADDPATLDRIEGEFDVLLMPAVLEHLKYPERVLQKLSAHLAPEGIAIASLPNIAYWRFRLRLLLGRFDYEDYGVMDRTHLRLYTARTGRELLEANGYHVVEMRTTGSALQVAANHLARRMGRPHAPNILPALLGYELIYRARPRS